MPLINAKCTNCGSNLQVDNTKDAWICDYCGSPFIVEKAINNYNTTNNIQANVVNIYGGNSADFVIRAGELEKYTGAATEVVIPSTVTIIGYGAFEGCSGLKSVTIPSSVTEIGTYAFRHCSGLESITIPSSVTIIRDSAFSDCTSLRTAILSNGLKTIEMYAFQNCSKLTTITIPDSVTKIGSYRRSYTRYPFEGCNSLTDIKYPSRFSYYVFEGSAWYRTEKRKREAKIANRICPDCDRKISFFGNRCPQCGIKY